METDPRPSPVRRFRWLIVAGVVALLAVTAGPWIYINLIKEDAPERRTVDDVVGSTTSGGADTTAPAGSGGAVDGTWTVADGSSVGYRVEEVLFGQSTEGVGTTEDVTGSVVLAGTEVTAAEFEADMTTVTSDESRRDDQFRGRIMETSEFPTATFVLTEPIDLGAVPADGERVTVDATGDLTLHGVTNEVTISLTAVLSGDTFAVDGSLPITFADYDIDNPSGGPASVGDEGALEVLLVFSR